MRKYILVVATALAIVVSSSALAQEHRPMHHSGHKGKAPSAEQVAQRMTDRMTSELKLSPEQSAQLYELNLNRIKQHQAEKEAQREKMAAERKASNEQLQEVLTPEQYAQWQKIRAERKQHRAGADNGECIRGKECCKARCDASKMCEKRCDKSLDNQSHKSHKEQKRE